MKRIVVLIASCLVIPVSLAQAPALQPSPAPKAPITETDPPIQAWSAISLDKNHANVVISTSAISAPRWYRLSNKTPLNWGGGTSMSVVADGKDLVYPINPLGSAIIFAKSLEARRITGSVPLAGEWKSFSDRDIASVVTSWQIAGSLTDRALVAYFDSPRDFVLKFDSGTCVAARFTVLIEGKTMRDAAGKVAEFIQNSGFIGRGQIIQVLGTGECDPVTVFGGTIQILNPDAKPIPLARKAR